MGVPLLCAKHAIGMERSEIEMHTAHCDKLGGD